MADRIKVGVKVRPLIKREKTDRAHIHWEAVSDTQIVQVDPVSGRQKNEPFTFDRVFGPSSSNQEVFEVLVKPIVESAVKGFNGTIFAYGQTASGKTYTMMGDQFEPGIIPQAVSLIFNSIENSQGREFLLRVCYMEIYNEKINDLLLKSNRNLKVTEDNLGNVIVKDLEETITSSAQMVMDLMKKGETIRKIGVTNMNERSSRSHSIFRVIIESRNTASDADEAIQVSHLNLVDLAGSERAGATGCVGDQFKEGCAINTSLFTLGKVIAQLSEGEATFVNFRDSKLTRILQSSLGGNALTAIICAVTPAALEETNSTLGFASRARNIKVSATVNEVLTDSALLKRYLRQIDRLNGAISALQEEKSAETENLQKENLLLQERISRLKDCLVVSGSEDTSEKAKSLKKLRRRTWSAPNRNVARLSLAFPKKPIHSLSNIKEEIPRLGVTLAGSMEFDEDAEDVFTTPLEEFEKALMKAERAKSMDGTDWTPSVDTFDDEDTLEDHVPPISYVQTRKPRCHVIKESFDPVTETPPSKLRAKMHIVEKELDELNEYTRLEKQVYNEELNAELDRVKAQLVESNSKCESLKTELSETREQLTSLQCVQEQMDKLKLSDRTSHDYQMLLIDSAKEQAQLRDRNKEIEQQLSDAIERCQGFAKLEEELAATTKLLEENCKGNAGLKERLKKQEGELRLLLNEKQDFDIQFSIQKSKYESRLKDLSQALEDARFELSQMQRPTQHKTYAGMGDLYSLEEEPAIDDLLNELAAKQLKISELERQLLTLKSSSVSTQQIEAPVFENDYLSEIRTLKEDNSAMIKEIEEKNGTLSEFVTELSKLQKELENSRNCTGEELQELKDELESEKKHLEEELTAAKNLLLEQVQELGVDEHVSLPHAISQFLLCLKSTNERCAEVEIRAQGLVHELSETKSMLSDLGTELHEREQQLQETAYEVDVLREQLQKQEKMNPCNLEQDQNEQLVLINAKLEIEKKTARDLRENLEDREKLLSETVTKLEDLRELSKLQKSESANEIAQLMNELETIKQTNTDLMKDLERSKDLTNKTTAQMEELQEQLCELQKCSQQSAEQHLEELARIRTELEGAQNAKESLQEDLVRKEQLILQADMDMKQLREQLSGLPNSEILTNEIMQIKSELVAVKELNEGLSDDLQSKESLLSASNLEKEQLRERLEELRELSELQKSESANEIAQLMNELETIKQTNTDLMKDLERSKDLTNKTTAQMEELQEQLCELQKCSQQSAEQHLEELARIRTELEGAQNAKESLQEDLVRKEQLILQADMDMKQLREQLSGLPNSEILTNEIMRIKNELVAVKELNEGLSDDLQSKESLLSASNLEKEQLRERLEELRELSELQKSESANEIAQLMNELETIKQTNTDLMKDLERSKDLTNKTTAQMEELQEQLRELQKCSQQSAEQHLEELARIRTELEGEQKAKESLQEDLVRKEQLILQADMDMKQLREQLSGLSNSEIVTNEIMRIKSELVAVKELNEGLRNDLQSKESLLSASATEIGQLREQLSELQCSEKSNNIISEELNSYKKKLFDLDNDLHHARALISAAVTDINCDESILFASLITQVLSRLSSATEMNKELENKNRTCQSQLEHLIQVSTEEFEGLKSNNDDLKAKLELTEASLNRISCDNEQLKDQLKDLQEMSSSIIQEIPPSQCDVEQLTNKIAELEDDVLKARSLCASIDGINADENISLASLLQQVIEVYKKFESEKQMALKHLQEVIGEHSEELVLVTNRLESEKVVNEGLRNQLNHQEACNAKHVVEIGHLEDKIKLSTQSVNPNPSDLEQLDISHKKSLMIEEDLEKVRSMLDTDARNESVPLSTLLTQFLDRLQSAEDRSSEFEHRHHVLSDELITVKRDLGAKASLLSQLSLNGSCIKCMTITDQPEQLIQVKHVANSLHGQGGTSDLERCEVTSAETHELCDDTENLKSVIKDLTNQLKLKDNTIVKAATEMEQLRDQIRKLESMDKIRDPCTPEKSIRCDSDVEVEETHSIRSSSEGEVESLSTTRKALLHELDAKDSLIEEIEDERRQLREKVRDLSNRQADVKEPGEGNCSISDTDVLKAQLNALKEELKSKDEIILGVQKELQQIRQDCSKLNAVLVADDVCQKCIILEEEKISFEKEIEFARNALLSEIKAISADSDIVDNTLASLVSQLLSSVMQAQAQVASIHQQNVDERTEKLQDCLHREKEHIETIKNLRMQLNEFAVGKKSLESALEALQSKCDESVEQQTQLKRNLEVTIESASKTAENLKLEEEECLKLKEEIVNLRNSVLSIRAELDNKVEGIEKLEQERARLKVMLQENSDKAQHAEKLEQELSELKLTLKENSKLIASKQALQSKVTSLYNDVVVNKELISKLETSIANDKLQLNEKEEIITSLNKRVEELEKEKNLLHADVTRVKAELDLLVKSTSTPSDEIAELKVEKEFLEKQYQNALKSSRETKTQNRKLHVELGKLRKDIEEGKKSTPDAAIKHLERQLGEEIARRGELEGQVDELYKELSQASRTKQSRVSDMRAKREASDARQYKAEIESLKEQMEDLELKYKSKLRELSSRSQDVSGLASTIEEKGETIKKLELECKEKADKISELEEEKLHLDKECDELLSWGRSMEASNIELAERLVNVLKDLAGSKSQLFSTVSENIFTLRKLSRVIVTSLSKVDSEQMEMQLTSKEKAARNSKTRVEKIKSQMQVIDCDRLQGLCAELHKENLLICNLLEETSNVFHKMMENAKHPSPLKECSSCTELQKWGLEQEARALALSEQVDRLEGRLKVRDENIVSHSTRSRAKRESGDEQPSNGHNCECQELIKSQREKLADKNAEITVLKLKQQIQNKPAEDMIKKQEEKLKLLREEVKSLKAQNRRLLSSYQDTTVCGQEVKMKSIQTQTLESADQIYKSQYWPSGPSGIVEEANRTTLEARVKKLEREKETYKALCVNRKERCDVLEKRVKELMKENQENEPHYTLRSRRNN
ncbi:hypothetical protein ONE63_001336 [Megalurothrips usitatus]|uniref:Kinesin motor domain-containing protein n=1 Tax=Megalurothrips usitatus TaxID=439358 RepID=A0AAV7XGG3_9NEOP|nr:hypothetical protein ONE63_001336 [Megalurothrips usitatus]